MIAQQVRSFMVPRGTYGVRVVVTLNSAGDGYACLETVSPPCMGSCRGIELRRSRIDVSGGSFDYPPFCIDWEEDSEALGERRWGI